jgi:hypothetical protein
MCEFWGGREFTDNSPLTCRGRLAWTEKALSNRAGIARKTQISPYVRSIFPGFSREQGLHGDWFAVDSLHRQAVWSLGARRIPGSKRPQRTGDWSDFRVRRSARCTLQFLPIGPVLDLHSPMGNSWGRTVSNAAQFVKVGVAFLGGSIQWKSCPRKFPDREVRGRCARQDALDGVGREV